MKLIKPAVALLVLLTFSGICLGKAKEGRLWHVKNTKELIAAYKSVTALKSEQVKDLNQIYGNGPTIVLAPGTYIIKDTLTFRNLISVNIIGSGWNTVIQKVGPGDALVFEEAGHSAVRNLKIIGDINTMTGSGIVFRGQGSSCSTVDYCRIRHFAQSGIRFEGDALKPMSSNVVSWCHLIGNRHNQLFSNHNHDFYFIGNQFGTHQAGQFDPNGPVPQFGAILDHSSAGTYTLNYHWDSVVGLKMTSGCHYNRIENNRFEESRHEGVILGDPNSTEPSVFNLFTGNTIHSNSKFNSGKFDAMIAYGAADTTFTSNQIFSWNSEKTLMRHCLNLGKGCNNWIIKDNIFRHNSESPALVLNENGSHLVKDNLSSDTQK